MERACCVDGVAHGHALVCFSCLASDLFDVQSSAAADDSEISNQCDSPVHPDAAAPSIDAFEQDEPADTYDNGDWDVTPAKQDVQSPEENSNSTVEDKAPRAPAVTNSVARFQQFQLQIPANHARLASMTAQ